MKISVFCSADSNIDPDFFKMTREFGHWMGKEKHTLVFGGCNLGLMECIAEAVREAGGHTIGVIPTRVETNGTASPSVDVEIPCDNLSDRKDLMVAQSDVSVVLPGGIGTLDELFTVAAAHTIGYHQKKVILYNMKGFWKPLIMLLDDLQKQGFIRGNYLDLIQPADNLQEVQRLLGKVVVHADD
ncbi:MAG: TIGR00730 family Rossman fold protein [Prevotella sp.]|jgi:uncharacterized protein (TIGR00730 family)|nr:TIGR00730 family Rossman fold protein [Prevotella sp.]MCH3994680.1 TIGR00730 family Rossman fold protein [Prevotella sp.]MCI1246415.1 TIGR00730 family Rossman fold protein [Prevotella sp.]